MGRCKSMQVVRLTEIIHDRCTSSTYNQYLLLSHDESPQGAPSGVNCSNWLLDWQVVVQLLSYVWLFVTRWTAACQASLSFSISWVCSNSCPLSWWCHPTTSSSVSSCPQSFPASGSFPISWLFPLSGQSIGALASASVYPEFPQNSPLDGFNMMAWWL